MGSISIRRGAGFDGLHDKMGYAGSCAITGNAVNTSKAAKSNWRENRLDKMSLPPPRLSKNKILRNMKKIV
jgi:hypothetical protein